MDTIDSYGETNQTNGYILTEPGHIELVGQSFTGDGNKLYRVAFYLKRYNSGTGNAYATIYSHSGVYGTSSLALNLMATSYPVDITTISSDYELVYFTFAADEKVRLVDGVYYCACVEYDDGNYASEIGLAAGFDATSSTHDGNIFAHDDTSGGWVALPDYDMCFYVYTEGTISAFNSPLPAFRRAA